MRAFWNIRLLAVAGTMLLLCAAGLGFSQVDERDPTLPVQPNRNTAGWGAVKVNVRSLPDAPKNLTETHAPIEGELVEPMPSASTGPVKAQAYTHYPSVEQDVIAGQPDVPGEALKSEFLSEQANAIRRFCHTLRCRVSNITERG
jgi:hypothetical protein